MNPPHGEVGSGKWAGARWCEGCGHYHGPLLICKHYGAALAARVRAEEDQFRAELSDPDKTDAEKMRFLIRTGVVEILKS